MRQRALLLVCTMVDQVINYCIQEESDFKIRPEFDKTPLAMQEFAASGALKEKIIKTVLQ